jgi:hypothetical protein
MSECTPGDLDPHAVASVFKAYLREREFFQYTGDSGILNCIIVPEPILTRALLPYFDAAINAETDYSLPTTSPPATATRVLKGPPLPSSVRNGIPNPMLRKPPSLSTLAMPSFSGMKPPSKSLLNALRTLIGRLPQENRDLIRIVAELIKATARESKATKMPLSNLLLVFCPSLNMNPPLLRVLCEGEGIWGTEGGDGDTGIPEVLDIRAVNNVRASEEAGDKKTSKKVPAVPEVISVSTTAPVDGESPVTEDPSPSVIHSRRTSTDTAISMSGGDMTPSPNISPDASKSITPVADVELPRDHPHALPALSSSAESVDTLSTSASSCDPSLLSNLTTFPDIDPFHKLRSHSSLDLATTLSLPMITESPLSPTPHQRQRRQPSPRTIRKISISSPISGPVHFPGTASQPVTPLSRPRSIPHISLPSFNIQPASPPLAGAPDSPTTSNALTPVRSRGGGLIKPSLQLLFAKPAASVPSATSLISFSPYAVQQQQQQPSPLQRPASDSSVGTPTTVYTAQSSTTHLPPVLDMPIDSSPIRLGLGLDGEVEQEKEEEKKEDEKEETINANLVSPSPPQDRTLTKLDIPSTLVSNTTSHTPIADLFLTPSSSLQSLLFPSSTVATTSGQALPPPIQRSTSSSISNIINDATTTTQPLRLRQPKPKASTVSLDRLGTIGHLGEDDDGEKEDWTKSVLLAAELNSDWLFQRGGEKTTEVRT